MTVGIQTVRIDEVTACAAKLGGLVVHHLGEALLRPADIFCQHVGGIVGRLHERRVHHVLQRHFLAGNQRNIGGVALNVDRRFGHCGFLGQIAFMFKDDECGHEFGDRGGFYRLVGVFFVQGLTGFHAVKQGFRGVDLLLERWGQSHSRAADEQQNGHDEQCQTADGHGRSPFIRFVIIIHDLPARFKADVSDKVLHRATKDVSGYFSRDKNAKLSVLSFAQAVTAGWTENGKRTIFCDRKSTGNSARCRMRGTPYPLPPADLCLT